MTQENSTGPKLSLKKKTSGTMTLNHTSSGPKNVQVEVRKKKVLVNPEERKAQLAQEAAAKKAAEEEALRQAELKKIEEAKKAQEAKAEAEGQGQGYGRISSCSSQGEARG